MDAKSYYTVDDGEFADVIIEAQKELASIVVRSLENHGFPTDEVTVIDTVKELCRITNL